MVAEGYPRLNQTHLRSFPLLTFRRPKTHRARIVVALGLCASVCLTFALPTSVSAEPADFRSTWPAIPAAHPKSVSQSAKAAKSKPKSSRVSVARAPNRIDLKLIRSIPREVSSGFTPEVNGFSFANWASDTPQGIISVDTLVRLFGTTPTCVSVVEGICNPSEQTTLLITRLNEILADGRCEGMVALADELFRHPASISSVSTETSDIASLSADQASSEIGYWWATQITPKAARAAQSSRKMSPARLVKTIAQRIKHKSGGTLGLYYKGKGHAVLPISVKRSGFRAQISVYDSNIPNTIQFVNVNLQTNTWRYKAINADGSIAVNWRGKNSGGLDFVAPSARRSQQVKTLSFSMP